MAVAARCLLLPRDTTDVKLTGLLEDTFRLLKGPLTGAHQCVATDQAERHAGLWRETSQEGGGVSAPRYSGRVFLAIGYATIMCPLFSQFMIPA